MTRLPDFIIGGAPKCATSSLHALLACHDEIGIPDREVHFFDSDDPITHPDFFFVENASLTTFDPDAPSGPAFKAYADCFRPFEGKRLVGEDSTTYLFSEVAAGRIKRMLPDVKLIFMLRDPVARAYSQYWHLVGTGRTSDSFERALVSQRSIVLGSTYARQLQRYFDLFGAGKVKVMLFEDLVADPQTTVDTATDFLGVARFTVTSSRSWSNRSIYPVSLALQLAVNRLRAPLVAGRYRAHLGRRATAASRLGAFSAKVLRRLTYNSLLSGERKPPMQQGTRNFLTRHFSERNRGLSEMLNRDLSQVWPGFTG